MIPEDELTPADDDVIRVTRAIARVRYGVTDEELDSSEWLI
jgi:hypothetical protein